LMTLIGSIAFNSLEIGSAKPGHASHDTHGSADQH
jgi:hypothetical protein